MKTLIWATFALLALIWTGLAAVSAGLAEWLIGLVTSGQATEAATAIGQWPMPAWAALWIDPAWVQALQLMWLDLVQWLAQVLPSVDGLGGWVTALVWFGWGVGLVSLLALCGGLHWLAGRVSQPRPA
jgi:hypothetical protein